MSEYTRATLVSSTPFKQLKKKKKKKMMADSHSFLPALGSSSVSRIATRRSRKI